MSVGRKLDDHVSALVDDPYVVLRVDANGVGHLEAVQAFANLANEASVLIEFEEARTFTAARVHKDVALRVCGHADALAQIGPGRELQKIWHGVVRNVLCGGKSLCRRRGALLRQAGCRKKQ